jgi:putative heme iron utilization protein
MGNLELERTSYIGFVSGKFEEKHFYNFFTFSAEGKNLRKII